MEFYTYHDQKFYHGQTNMRGEKAKTYFNQIWNFLEISSMGMAPGAHFTNNFSILIQIRWKFHYAVI